MNVETLKFLLKASEYLKVAPLGGPAARDLQAVDRTLPDCDWFELGENSATARQSAASLWCERRELEF